MKKLIALFAILALIVSFSACGVPQSGVCSHNYYLSDRKSASSTDDGYNQYTCLKCGRSYKEVIPATGDNTNIPSDNEIESSPANNASIALFDLSEYSEKGTHIVYVSDTTDAAGWRHEDCYSLDVSSGTKWARYALNGNYHTLSGKIYADDHSDWESGWLDFYDGEEYLFSTPKVNKNNVSAEFSFDISGVDYLTVYFRSDATFYQIIADDIIISK